MQISTRSHYHLIELRFCFVFFISVIWYCFEFRYSNFGFALNIMLKLKIIMNSNLEEVLSARCVGLHNQNLELHVQNNGDETVTISGGYVLENNTETFKCGQLFPPWEQPIYPGRTLAFYSSMDENIWNKFNTITISDTKGNGYSFPTSKAVFQ